MTTLEKPEPLQEWFNKQREVTPDEMYYKGASARQIMWVRDTLANVFNCGLVFEERRQVEVIATHTSKSVLLPVYSLERADCSLRLVLRENFFNWKLSVISGEPLDVDFSGLFHTTPPIDPSYTGNPLASVYFEGFPEDLIFGYYAPSDKRRFSAEIWGGDEALWTTVFLIMRARGVVTPFEWSTRKEAAP